MIYGSIPKLRGFYAPVDVIAIADPPGDRCWRKRDVRVSLSRIYIYTYIYVPRDTYARVKRASRPN